MIHSWALSNSCMHVQERMSNMHGLKLASFNNGNMVIAALDESHISPNQVCPQTLQTFDRYADRYCVNSQLHIGFFCCSITNETHWSGNRISDNFYDCIARRLFCCV